MVPVVPCAVETFGWSVHNRRPCAVVWGEPIEAAGRDRTRGGYEALMQTVRSELMRLWRQAAEAVAAGLPPELPDGTKRYRTYLPGIMGESGRPLPG